MSNELPVLVTKALIDTGYDLITVAGNGWVQAAISGSSAHLLLKAVDSGTLLAMPEPTTAGRIGLQAVADAPPPDMADIGCAVDAAALYDALRLLHALQTHPARSLSARVEERLAAIPATERTREVRQRIGQEVFREALVDMWQGRCAITGLILPSALLRASHAKPWAKASDAERLDPFNGLLLAVHLDAMFDAGLIAVGEDGRVLYSPKLDAATRVHFGLRDDLRIRALAPGHLPYLQWHREHLFQRSHATKLHSENK